MASKRPNNSRDIGFYFKKKKTDSANGVNNQPDATPNSSDDVTNESHVTKNCSDRVATQSSPLPNANRKLKQHDAIMRRRRSMAKCLFK